MLTVEQSYSADGKRMNGNHRHSTTTQEMLHLLALHTRKGHTGLDERGRVYPPTQSVRVGDDRDLVSVTEWDKGRAAGPQHLWEGPYPGGGGRDGQGAFRRPVS